MPYLKTSSGINWFYEAKGEGRALVFIHGWAFDSDVWFNQIDSFNKFKVITLDLPGHGNSEYKNDTDIVKDLYFIFKELRLNEINLIGHSFGGLVGLKFDLNYPKLINRLILIGTNAKFVRCSQYPYGLSKEEVNKLREFISDNYPDILLVFMRWLFTKEERSQNDFREIWNLVSKRKTWSNKEALGEFLGIIEKEDLRSQLDRVNLPTLVIAGTDDPICPVGLAHYLNEHINNSRIELFTNCGHLPFLTQPQKFNKVMKEFLA